MRRKRLFMVLMSTLVLTACGNSAKIEKANEKLEESTAESTVESTVENTEENTPENAEEVEQGLDAVEPLNIENDGFSFESLLSQIGGATPDACGLIGVESAENIASTSLFGEGVEIKINESEGIVKSIHLVFAETEYEQLKNAIGEQMGQDGTEGEGTVTWQSGTTTVLLSVVEEKATVDILGEGEVAAEGQPEA